MARNIQNIFTDWAVACRARLREADINNLKPMDRNKFTIKINTVEGLLSAKSVFDRGAIGDIDGAPMFVNAFWFAADLYVKYIEVSAARDGKNSESLFMAPAAVFLFGEELAIPKTGNFLKLAAGDYSKLDFRRGPLARISGRTVAPAKPGYASATKIFWRGIFYLIPAIGKSPRCCAATGLPRKSFAFPDSSLLKARTVLNLCHSI